MATLNIDEHADARPITRESFLAAYVDEYPWNYGNNATLEWSSLHNRALLSDEVNEDPS